MNLFKMNLSEPHLGKAQKTHIKNRYEVKNGLYENPFSTIIFGVFAIIGFVLFSSNIISLNLEELGILLIYPCLLICVIWFSIRWDAILGICVLGIGGYFAWKGETSLYFTLPLTAGGILASSFRVIKEWQRAIVLRLGKFHKAKGPGLFFLLPFFDSVNKIVDCRIRVSDLVAETTLTSDSVPVTVDALAFWMVWDPEKAVLEVEHYVDAVVLSALASLREAIGETDLTTLLVHRHEVGREIRKHVERKTEEWGITIQSIEITDIIIPEHLQDVMSKRAQAEREKQSRILQGEAEIEVAKKLHEAAEIYNQSDLSIKLRELGILQEGLQKKNSMLMVPSSLAERAGSLMGVQALSEVEKLKQKEKAEESTKEPAPGEDSKDKK